jgi:hypothetical protein
LEFYPPTNPRNLALPTKADKARTTPVTKVTWIIKQHSLQNHHPVTSFEARARKARPGKGQTRPAKADKAQHPITTKEGALFGKPTNERPSRLKQGCLLPKRVAGPFLAFLAFAAQGKVVTTKMEEV